MSFVIHAMQAVSYQSDDDDDDDDDADASYNLSFGSFETRGAN
jgi:hypothetical protein